MDWTGKIKWTCIGEREPGGHVNGKRLNIRAWHIDF